MEAAFPWLDEPLLRGLGKLYLALTALGVLAFLVDHFRKPKPTDGPPVEQPLLQIELAESCERVAEIVRSAGKKRLRTALGSDFVLIAVYGSALLLAGLLLARRDGAAAPLLGIAGAICAVAAALADTRENLLMNRILEACSARDLAALRVATRWKWSLIAAAFVLVSALFFPSGGWGPVVGGLCVIAGASGAYGAARNAKLLKTAFLLMSLALAGFYLLLAFRPEDLLS